MNRWWWLLLIVAVVAAVGGSYLMLERHTYTVSQGYSAKARANPFLAAHLLIKETGVVLEDERNAVDFSEISSQDSVFLSDLDDMLFTERKIDQALEWVDAGGHIVAGVGALNDAATSLLHRLDVYVEEAENETQFKFIEELESGEDSDKSVSEQMREFNRKQDEKDAQSDVEGQTEESELSGEENESVTAGDGFDLLEISDKREKLILNLSDDIGQITLEVVDNILLSHPHTEDWKPDPGDEDLADENSDSAASYADELHYTGATNYELGAYVADSQGPRLLQFSYGDGTITLLSSSRLWQNQEIGRVDNAYLLSYLVGEVPNMHFFYNVSSPSLASILRQYFPELLLSSALLIFFWLWRSALRVQGVRDSQGQERRDFNEHLSASAQYLAKHKQYGALLGPINDEIVTKMRVHQANFARLETPAQASLLSDKTGIAETHINRWLSYLHKVKTPQELKNAIVLGTQIRKKL